MSGFVAEMTIFFGAFEHPDMFHRVLTIASTMSIVITAVYILRMVGKFLYGPMQDKHHAALTDAVWYEKIAVVTLISFYIGLQTSPAVASTMAFATLTLARLFHGFNCRSTHSIFKLGLFSNTASIGAFFIGTLLLAFVLFVPFMQPLFSVTALTGAQAGFIALLAFIPTFIIQFVKVIVENVRK